MIGLQSHVEKQKAWVLESERGMFPESSNRTLVEFNNNPEQIEFSQTLTLSLAQIERRLEATLSAHPYRVIIIIHNSSFNDVVTAFAFHLRKEHPKMAVYIKHRSRRQLELGEHISVAML